MVYLLAAKVVQSLNSGGRRCGCFRYDNMCKLQPVVKAKAGLHEPITRILADTPMLLDGLHRSNHTWCLEHRPFLDPEREENQHLVQNVNSMCAEQLNKFISERAYVSMEMTMGRHNVFWWIMFIEHNRWLTQRATQDRRRFCRGYMQHNPDHAQQRVR